MMQNFVRLFIIFITISMIKMSNITENTQRGIVFTEMGETNLISGYWKICMYYNLTEYHEEIRVFKSTLEQADKICHKTFSTDCQIVVGFFKSQYENMKLDVQNLNTNRRLSKRSVFPTWGKINHWLTGVVDEDTAKEYENKINELTMAINERHTLESNKTTIIRKSLIAIKNETDSVKTNMENLHRSFKDTMEIIQNTLDKNDMATKLNFITQLGTLIIIEHKEITDKLTRANPAELLEFDTIQHDFRHIQENSPKDQALPLSIRRREDIYKILEISHSKMRVTNELMLLELSIPLVEDRTYSIFKTIPIPIKYDGTLFGIKSQKKNIIANIDNKEYLEISEVELNQCVHIEQKRFICQTTAPTIVSNFDVCEADILFGEGNTLPRSCTLQKIPNVTYVSETNKPGVYILTPNKPMKIRTICHETRVDVMVIDKQIELSTKKNCVMRVGRFRLRQNGIFVSNHTHAGIVEANFKHLDLSELGNIKSVNLTARVSELALIDNDFSKLIQETEILEHKEGNMKQIKKLETDYTTHSYTIAGLSISTIIILGLLCYVVFFKVCPLATEIAKIVNHE